MAADGGGALNHEADSDGVFGLWSEVNVLAGDIGRAIIVELQQKNFARRHGARAHDGGGKGAGNSNAAPR